MGVEALRTRNSNRPGIVVAMAADIEDQSVRIGEPGGDGPTDSGRATRHDRRLLREAHVDQATLKIPHGI